MRTDRTLLLVDDEENILNSLRRTLRRDGYKILTAMGGEEGLNVLAEHEIGVIVSDQRMPGMIGSEFLSRAREQYPDTVRIMLSGYTELNSVTDAINQGAIYKFLTKPWEDDLLRANIQDAFNHYDLHQENKRLSDELVELNKSLEQRVDDRTRELMLSIHSLQLGQDILEELPCGVIGLDNDNTIVNANAYAQIVLNRQGIGIVGKDAKDIFPDELYSTLASCNKISDKTKILAFYGKQVAVNIRKLGNPDNNHGSIIACMLIEKE